MKKSKYISKYDYIAYYTKPPFFWFYKNDEITASLQIIYKSLTKSSKLESNIFNIDFENEEEFEGSENEIDSYEAYLIAKEEFKNIDANNPQIAEGIIIDSESKKFIEGNYKSNLNTIVIDFDHEIYKYKSMEEIAEITKDYILNNEYLIMFQPVFINNKTITKPDAFIKNKSDILVIETKATSTAKKQHFLDLLFQKNVIENQKYLKDLDCIFDYKLCLVKYEYLNKKEVSFVITPYINYTKSYSEPEIIKKSPNKILLKSKAKIGYHIVEDTTNFNDNYESKPLRIKELLNNNLIDLYERMELYPKYAKHMEKAISEFHKVNNEYDDVIENLWNHKLKMKETDYVKEIYPNKNDKGDFKNFDYFLEERKIYSLLGYNRFDYSGLYADQTKNGLDNCKKNEKLEDFIKSPKNATINYIELFSVKNRFLMNEKNTKNLWSKLKSKKVYFDFETLNPAIRAADKSLPFTQVVTQCSIIKDFGEGIDKQGSNNLIIDPLEINDEWYKKIIDDIYSGPEPTYNKNEKLYTLKDKNDYSYIVYNKSFEQTRLKEMKAKLNDQLYDLKVDSIIKNIYDIADFFKISSKNGYVLFFEELKGFYSIKKVLPLIEKHAPHIFNKTNCLDYNSLEVSNGKICQEKTAQRFFEKLDKNEWIQLEDKLKIYCENDVRAMVAVEYFVKEIIDGKLKIK